jgi:IPT/TIG domain/FG-GAP repeat
MLGLAGPIESAMGRRARHAAAVVLAALATSICLTALAREHAPAPVSTHAALGSARSAELHALPAAARGVISNALGADERAYHVRTRARGVLAAHTGAMRARFDAAGVSVDGAGVRFSLSLRAEVAGRTRTVLPPVAPRAHANTVTYSYGALSAWYRNGPAGLEQGFTIAHPPAGNGPLTLSLAVAGNARLALTRGGRGVTFTRAGSAPLSLGALAASDARGHTLASTFVLEPGGLGVRVDTTHARFPVTIDPLLEQGTRLTGAGETGEGNFGLSVAVSRDGSTALVGAPRDNNFVGAVWVFTRSGTTWSQQGSKLLPGGPAEHLGCQEEPIFSGTEESECGFGASVALSGDGDTAIVGAPRDNNYQGGAWVFTRSGSTWTRQATELTGAGEVGEGHFGKSVALSEDGTLALVAAPSDGKSHGAVWTFKWSGSSWTSAAEKLTPSDETGAGYFGRGLALSPNGKHVIVGAPGDSGYRGAAWAFTRSELSATGWAKPEKITGGEEGGLGRFGFAVAISEDGDTALVGGPHDEGDLGAAWLFAKPGKALAQSGAKITGPGEIGSGMFGRTLALSASGQTAIIGAPRDDSAVGAAWVYTFEPGGAVAEKFGADNTRGQFGASIALSADGDVPLFGEPLAEKKAGVAWAGLPPAVVSSVAPASGPAAGGTEVTITGAGFDEASAVRFGERPAAYVVKSSTTIVATSPPGAGGTTVDVTVTTPHGTSEASFADEFTYLGSEGEQPGAHGGEATFSAADPAAGTLGFKAVQGCRVALVSRKVSVLKSFRATPRLRRLGAGRCAGRLTLAVRVKSKHGRRVLRSIGTARFSISGSRAVTVRVKLNSYGRTLLRSHRGQLRASLLIARLLPLPTWRQSATVRLRIRH